MASLSLQGDGQQALSSAWPDETSLEASSPPCPVSALFGWQGGPDSVETLVGADFTAEVESVSALFPHLDGLPAELIGGSLGVAEQAAVCGGTSVALGAGGAGTPPAPGSPADQCLMSPSDALLASPDPVLAASPARVDLRPHPASELAPEWYRREAGLGKTSLISGETVTTLIDFLPPPPPPPRGTANWPPSAAAAEAAAGDGDVFVSHMETSPAPITDGSRSASIETTTDTDTDYDCNTASSAATPAGPPATPSAAAAAAAAAAAVIEFSQSPLSGLTAAERAAAAAGDDEEDEHARMIDQALEDLKTLESMCGITSGDDSDSAAAAASLAAEDTVAAATSSTATETPAVSAAGATAGDAAVKQEPAEQEEAEIEILEERAAPRRRHRPRPRRRPPRVAVTPATAATAPPPPPQQQAAAAPQIVIVLTGEQLASIQQSGQIVLNAAALQPALAASTATAAAPTTSTAAAGRSAAKRRAVVKTAGGAARAVVKPAVRSDVKLETVSRPSSSGCGSGGAAGRIQTGRQTDRKCQPAAAGRQQQQKVRRALKIAQRRTAGGQDPLSGWLEQKLPPSAAWEFPLPPEQPEESPLDALDACIPDDLQDVLLDGGAAGAGAALCAEDQDADGLLQELISGSVRENPGLFDAGCCSPLDGGLEEPAVMAPAASPQGSPQPLLLTSPPPPPPPVGFSLSPATQQQQLTLESWVPTLCPSPGESPLSPLSECAAAELAPAPDWSPVPAASRGARRPRPYDKPAGRGGATTATAAGRRQPLSEQERRDRKKEQNKNAATRYRQKKKEEHDLVSEDQEKLEARNKQLRERVGALSRELNYLKQLMREVLRHKQVTA